MKSETSTGSNSVVSRNITVEGEIRGNENLTVEGTVKGNLKLNGDILIGESGVVEADIEANSVVIKGKVSGDVTARNGLEVYPSGELYGIIRARLIHIREGAVFEGRSQMIRSPNPGAVEAPDKKKPVLANGENADTAGKPGVVNG